MKKAFCLLVALCMLLALVGCGNTPASQPAAGSEGGASAPATPEGDSIAIGGLAPLTGNVAQYGVASSNGSKLAVEEINAAGGVLGKPINFVLYDEKGDPTEALTAYNKLVENDGVVALVGDITTKPTIAVAQRAVEDNLPMITPTGTGAAITEGRPNVFRACFTDPYQGEMMAHYAQDTLGATTAAILYDTGDDYSSGVADQFEATAQELGITLTTKEGYESGAVDFNAQLTKIKDGNPDVIMVPCYYEDAAKIAVQARGLGITSSLLGSDGWNGTLDQLDASNYEALNNSFYCNQYSLGQPGAELQAFIDKYKATYNEDPTMFAVLGYEAMHLMAAAINEAGSTESDAIIAALSNLSWNGVSGNISFKGGNDPTREAYIIEFKDGVEDVLGTYSF